MSNSITPDNMASKAKLQAQTQVKDGANKKSAPKDVNGYLQLLSDGLIEKGVTKEEVKQFIEHPIVQKTTEKYVQSLAKNNANAKTGGGALAGLNIMARIMVVFSFTQTRLNDKVALLNKEQDKINKLVKELAKVVDEIKAGIAKGGTVNVKIPPDLLAYLKKNGPSSYTNTSGTLIDKPLYDATFHKDTSKNGDIIFNKNNGKAMADAFSGMQTALTTGNTTKVKVQSATQKLLNFTKEMGHLITAIYSMLKENARKL